MNRDVEPRDTKFWDRVAKMNRGPNGELGPTATKTVRMAREHLSPQDVVLDVGCGPGELTLAMAAQVKRVRGIDPSAGMIKAANDHLAELQVENASFTQGDSSTVAGGDEEFTAVTAFNLLHYMEDITQAVRGMGDCLPKGGLFLSATACMGERTTWLGTLVRLLTAMRLVPRMQFLTARELTEQISAAGFSVSQVQKLSDLPEYFIVAQKQAGR